ncbi:MAG: hypothetical protein WAT93_09380 [Pontixanthobacter sp.]
MVYRLNLNRVQPPYKLVINDVSDLLRPYITDFASWVLEARDDRNTDPAWGDDVEVTVIVQ